MKISDTVFFRKRGWTVLERRLKPPQILTLLEKLEEQLGIW